MDDSFHNLVKFVFKKRQKIASTLRYFICGFLLFIEIDLPLIPGSVYASIKADTLTIIHITDTHICNLTEYHPIFVKKRQQYGNGIEPLKQFFSMVPFQLQADMVVNTGDNIDFFRSTTVKREFLDTQIEQYARLIEDCPVTFFCTLGNHDIQQYWVNSDSSYVMQKHNAHQARAVWIRNVPCFRNGTYYSRIYQIGATHYRLIFLDNAYRADSPLPFIIDSMQLDWLNYQLSESANDVEILFMHLPLPIEDANHDGNSFSRTPIALDSSTIASNVLLTSLNANPSIRLLVTGHGHKNIIEAANFPTGHTIIQIETGAFGQNSQNWRLIRITEGQISISKPGSDFIEHSIPIH